MTLDQLEALCRGATPGPYSTDGHGRSVYCQNKKIGGVTTLVDVRGWGYLTGQGHGALGLPVDEAIEIQTATAAYIAACSPDYILKLIRVARAAEALHSSAHNGNVYAEEYDQLDAALTALTPETGNE